jgi:branched-chain amino acid transport system permease protein
MMVRDMDIAAQLMGVRLFQAKLTAFAVSSFYCGVAGAMLVTLYLTAAEPGAVFTIRQSFLVLFMVVLGGLGSLIGSYFGAAFILLLPIVLRTAAAEFHLPIEAKNIENLQFMIVGALIILFLKFEPHGLARLWQVGKQKLRVWPFPY